MRGLDKWWASVMHPDTSTATRALALADCCDYIEWYDDHEAFKRISGIVDAGRTPLEVEGALEGLLYLTHRTRELESWLIAVIMCVKSRHHATPYPQEILDYCDEIVEELLPVELSRRAAGWVYPPRTP